jgi:ABC-2 type transport system ATP-binding protein
MPRLGDDPGTSGRPLWQASERPRPPVEIKKGVYAVASTTDVSVRGLSKHFGPVRAVHELTFEVPPGRVTGFLGPNGAGKTTTLRMMLGLIRPSAGEALIGGRRYEQLPAPRRVVGAVLEATGFHPGRRGRDHLRIAAQVAGLPAGRVDDVLDQVGLTDSAARRVGGYSLGMRQRLGLAAALLGDPQLLILDEPGNGLDPAGMAWLRGLLRDLAGQGRTVIVSSHVLSEVAQTVDHVVIVGEGRLRFDGALHELAENGTSLEEAFLRLTGVTADPGPAMRSHP